jgi:hypothetical protein
VYHTPGGDRILRGAERRLFTQSLAMIVDLLAQGDAEFDVIPFDALQLNQKLVVLYNSARALLRPDEPAPKLTASVESAVAIVYEHVKNQVYLEIDVSHESKETPFWRKLVLDAAREQVTLDQLPHDWDCDKETWTMLVECLAGCVLWDNDYESQVSLDIAPEESRRIRALLGIDDNYYTEVLPDPPDDQANLYLDALMGLTADAR